MEVGGKFRKKIKYAKVVIIKIVVKLSLARIEAFILNLGYLIIV